VVCSSQVTYKLLSHQLDGTEYVHSSRNSLAKMEKVISLWPVDGVSRGLLNSCYNCSLKSSGTGGAWSIRRKQYPRGSGRSRQGWQSAVAAAGICSRSWNSYERQGDEEAMSL